MYFFWYIEHFLPDVCWAEFDGGHDEGLFATCALDTMRLAAFFSCRVTCFFRHSIKTYITSALRRSPFSSSRVSSLGALHCRHFLCYFGGGKPMEASVEKCLPGRLRSFSFYTPWWRNKERGFEKKKKKTNENNEKSRATMYNHTSPQSNVLFDFSLFPLLTPSNP
jgi:hypothetical protein